MEAGAGEARLCVGRRGDVLVSEVAREDIVLEGSGMKDEFGKNRKPTVTRSYHMHEATPRRTLAIAVRGESFRPFIGHTSKSVDELQKAAANSHARFFDVLCAPQLAWRCRLDLYTYATAFDGQLRGYYEPHTPQLHPHRHRTRGGQEAGGGLAAGSLSQTSC